MAPEAQRNDTDEAGLAKERDRRGARYHRESCFERVGARPGSTDERAGARVLGILIRLC